MIIYYVFLLKLKVAYINNKYIIQLIYQALMNSSQIYKQLQSTVRSAKCKNKDCLSKGADNLQVVWFGKQYQQKMITCSSCYIMNDQVVKKSIPTSMNILPVSAFLTKFTNQLKKYEQNRSSNNWQPLKLKAAQKQHQCQMQNFETKLNVTLKSLFVALEGFTKKVIAFNQQIYNNTTFNEIIGNYSNNTMQETLTKMNLLIKFLNFGEDGNYRFDDLQLRDKKIKKLQKKINEVTQKILKVLDELHADIHAKNANISKI